MKNRLFVLPAEVRRALAAKTRRERCATPKVDDAAMNAAFDAFYSGFGRPGFGSEFEARLRELSGRIDSNTLTADDAQLLSNIPSGSLSGVEIVRTFVQIFDEL